MVRGGARLNAGAKAKWKHGKTKTIRVPEVLVDQVIDYAKKLDDQQVSVFSESSKVLNLSGISVYMLSGKKFVYVSDLIKLGYDIKPHRLAIAVSMESKG
jgi:hypothetical protein